METTMAAFHQRKFLNPGLVNGPFCVIYGIAAVLMSVSLRELTGIWLFFFAAGAAYEDSPVDINWYSDSRYSGILSFIKEKRKTPGAVGNCKQSD